MLCTSWVTFENLNNDIRKSADRDTHMGCFRLDPLKKTAIKKLAELGKHIRNKNDSIYSILTPTFKFDLDVEFKRIKATLIIVISIYFD